MFRHYEDHLTSVLWDSVAEPVETARSHKWVKPTQKKDALGFAEHTRETPNLGWVRWLGAVPQEFTRRLREGWPEGSERLLKIATRDINPQSIRRRRERADQGSELDIHAVYRGDLSRAWTRTKRRTGSGVRSLSIIIDLAASWQTDAEQLFWRGASALKLASALIESGYSVAIYGASAAGRLDYAGDETMVQLVEIKAEDQPLDIDRLAALTAMPGFFRSSLFAGKCWGMDMLRKTASEDMGVSAPKSIAKAIPHLPIPQDAFIQKPVLDQAAAEAWIDEVLNALEQTESVPA